METQQETYLYKLEYCAKINLGRQTNDLVQVKVVRATVSTNHITKQHEQEGKRIKYIIEGIKIVY